MLPVLRRLGVRTSRARPIKSAITAIRDGTAAAARQGVRPSGRGIGSRPLSSAPTGSGVKTGPLARARLGTSGTGTKAMVPYSGKRIGPPPKTPNRAKNFWDNRTRMEKNMMIGGGVMVGGSMLSD